MIYFGRMGEDMWGWVCGVFMRVLHLHLPQQEGNRACLTEIHQEITV